MKTDWLNRTEYPFTSKFFDIDGHKMHFIDEGKGETVLFVHGTPSWSFDFRNIIKALSKNYRCIAIDHIGFGLSDKPEHHDYSTQNHSLALERFIEENNLNDITLVVHDFGGPIGLNVAIKHPEKIKRLVILNSWMWSSAKDKEFIRFSKILKSPLLPFLYRYLNFSPRFLLPASFGNRKLPKRLLSQFTKPFANRRERNGALAFAHSLLNDQDWFESLWREKEKLNQKPTLFIWGIKDRFISQKYLEKFKSGFKNHQTLELHDCGHFPQEEHPPKVASQIRHFIESNLVS